MGLTLWKKKRLIRRYSEPVNVGGYQVPFSEDLYIMADVQTTGNTSATGADGDISTQSIKVFTDTELKVADERTGARGDRIWFQDKWFECRSARLSENTFLKHWTCTFVQCTNQEESPVEE